MLYETGALENFPKIQRKAPVSESLFNKVAGLKVFFCEFLGIFYQQLFLAIFSNKSGRPLLNTETERNFTGSVVHCHSEAQNQGIITPPPSY